MEKDTLLINLMAGPGTGKSQTAGGVFSLLKLHGVDCELVTEFAKDLTWEERYKTLQNQYYIFGKQHHRLWRLNKSLDVIITDSPLMFSIIYGTIYDNISEEFKSTVLDVINDFNNFNVFLERVKEYNPNGRSQTEEEAKDIDLVVKNTLSEYGMDWIEVPGNHEGINEITRAVLSKLNIRLATKMTSC